MTAFAIAWALFGAAVSAPIWLCLGAITAAGRTALTAVRTRVRSAWRLTVLVVRTAAEVVREEGMRETVTELRQAHTGKHTPRGGTPTITGAIVPAPTTKELAA